MIVTFLAKRVKYIPSSTAESPPPITAISRSRKNAPSQTAQYDTPRPAYSSSPGTPSLRCSAPVAMMTAFALYVLSPVILLCNHRDLSLLLHHRKHIWHRIFVNVQTSCSPNPDRECCRSQDSFLPLPYQTFVHPERHVPTLMYLNLPLMHTPLQSFPQDQRR